MHTATSQRLQNIQGKVSFLLRIPLPRLDSIADFRRNLVSVELIFSAIGHVLWLAPTL